MDLIAIIIYGLLQGLTEFFPVSSSAHLALIPKFLSISDPGVGFDLMMHLGTALAVVVYYRKRLWRIVKTLPSAIFPFKRPQGLSLAPPQNRPIQKDLILTRNFILTTFTTVAVILLIRPMALSLGRTIPFMAFNLAFFGLLLYLSDRLTSSTSHSDDGPYLVMEQKVQWKKAALIGLAQAFAIFPGVSRSGITLTAARGLGMNRKESTEYSFLLSLPIIFAGSLQELLEFSTGASSYNAQNLIGGVLVSFFVGLTTIHFFLKIFEKIGLLCFFLYRLILAVVIFFTFY